MEIHPQNIGKDVPAVALDRIDLVPEPDYCTHGRANCLGCGKWCWVGDKTGPALARGEVKALCIPCLQKYADPGSKVGNLNDRKRAEGPH